MLRTVKQPWVLPEGNVHLVVNTALRPLSEDISGNSYHSKPRLLAIRPSNAQLFAQGIFAGPARLRELLTHNHHPFRGLRIVFVEAASTAQRNLRRSKIVGARNHIVGV